MNSPTEFKRRQTSPDAARGFALLVILLLNMRDFSFTGVRPEFAGVNSPFDASLLAFLETFLRPIGYPLFAVLFGFGFWLSLQRLGFDGYGVFWRRLVALAVVGFLHGVFIWRGDILLLYATVATSLLVLRRLPASAWLVSAVILFVVQVLVNFQLASLSGFGVSPAGFVEVYATGDFSRVTVVRAVEFLSTYLGGLMVGPHILGCFLFGGWLASVDAFRSWQWASPFWWLAAFFGLAFAAAGAFVVASVLLVLAVVLRGWSSRWLVDAGRVSLSLYLMQSLVCSFVFYGYGLGLFGSVSVSWLLSFAVVLYGCQLALARWWLRRFAMGPVEALVRRWSYSRYINLIQHRFNP